MELNELFKIVVGWVLPVLLLLALAWINEVGFERLVSKPLVEPYAKAFKHLQPFLLLVVSSLFSFGFGIDIVELLNKVYPIVSAEGDTGKLITTLLVAVLSMKFHQSAKTS